MTWSIGAGYSELSQLDDVKPTERGGPQIAYDLVLELDERSEWSDRVLDAMTFQMSTGHGRKNVRRTYRDRLTRLHGPIRDLLAETFGSDAEIRLHDAGASNAITSAELFTALADFPRLRLHASDFTVHMTAVRLADGWRVIFDQFDAPIQIVGPGVVLRYPTRNCRKTPLLCLRTALAARRALPQARRALAGAGPGAVQRLDLFHPEARALAAAEPRFTLGRCDMLEMPESSADAILVTNVVFNWPEANRRALYPVLYRALSEGGLLIVGRIGHLRPEDKRQEDLISYSAFRKTPAGFIEIRAGGGGYETRLVTDVRPGA